MGIHGFQPWLRATFGQNSEKSRYFYDFQAYINATKRRRSKQPKKVRRLFFDLNALIHNAVNQVYSTFDEEVKEEMYETPEEWLVTEGGVFHTVLLDILEVVKIIQPTELIYLAADGVVTRAKMQQQRERSFAATVTSPQPFDRTQIKPGTEFMNSLSTYIKENLPKMYRQNKNLWPRFVEFSDASMPGEGEHKIMKRLVQKPKRPTADFREDIDVIYSPDSDMALLAMLHAAVDDNVIVMREQHGFDARIDDFDSRWEYYDATGIRRDLRDRYGISHILDFILITIFAGNDFMPEVPFAKDNKINVFNGLVDAYKEVFTDTLRQPNIVRSKEIDWRNLLIYMKYLKIFAQGLLSNMAIQQFQEEGKYVRRDSAGEILEDRRWSALELGVSEITSQSLDKKGATIKSDSVEMSPMVFRHAYQRYINGIWADPQEFSQISLFQTRDMVTDYLSGLRWVIGYYISQEANINVNWVYMHNYAPCLADLVEITATLGRDDFEMITAKAVKSTGKMVTPVEHLAAILPKEKLHFLPKVMHSALLTYLPELFPSDFIIDYNFVAFDEDKGREISKAKVLINVPSLNNIHKIFLQFQEDPTVKAAIGDNKLWKRTIRRLK